MASPTIAWVPEGMILACLSVAVATDLASRIIPNRLVLLVLCASVALRLLSEPGPLWLGLLGLVAVLVALSLLASRDLVGWGDAKLIAAVSVAVPADRLLTTAARDCPGGRNPELPLPRVPLHPATNRLSPGPALPASEMLPLLFRLADRECARIRAGEPMPYAVAIFGGVTYTLVTG